jgi:hypothetical protein
MLSILFLFSSVAAGQQQRNQFLSPSIQRINVSTTILSTVRRRVTLTSTTLSPMIIQQNEFESNATRINQTLPQQTRSTVHLAIIIVICSLMTCVTIVGNLVVILAVCIVRKLQTASNILIVSLAVSDIFVGLFIMPLAMGNNQFA